MSLRRARCLYTAELVLVAFSIVLGTMFFPPALLSIPALFGLVGAISNPRGFDSRSWAGIYIHGAAAVGLILLVIVGAVASFEAALVVS